MNASLLAEAARSTSREKNNWYIHQLYLKRDFPSCLKVIEEQLRATNGQSEYALYIKALILRQGGRVEEALNIFQAALCLNPVSVANLKQVGLSLHLLGKHKTAIDVFEEAEHHAPDDRDIHHSKGMCHFYLKNYDRAVTNLETANSIQRHEASFVALGQLYEEQSKYKLALGVYIDALEVSPESTDILANIGLLYMKIGDNTKAFEYLGNALTYDPKNQRAILAAGSIIQDNGDVDVALSKYRLAIIENPNSAQLWNNIGLCFFSKGTKIVAAVSCLRRAAYICPFEWMINYNLGVTYLALGQYASAFHYFSASINMHPGYALSYSYLAVTLSKLDDFDNSCGAYEKALGIQDDATTRLNYAVTLYRYDEIERAKQQLARFETLYLSESEKDKEGKLDAEVPQMAALLKKALV